jgi:hypothetical protein
MWRRPIQPIAATCFATVSMSGWRFSIHHVGGAGEVEHHDRREILGGIEVGEFQEGSLPPDRHLLPAGEARQRGLQVQAVPARHQSPPSVSMASAAS